TKQLGTSGLGKAKNSRAEGKVCTLNPANRTRAPRALRIDSSSSTTYTIALVLLINHRLLIEKDSSKAPPTRTLADYFATPCRSDGIHRLPFATLSNLRSSSFISVYLRFRAASIASSKSSSLNGLSK